MTTLYRGLPACSCLQLWLPAYEELLQFKGVLVGPLRLYQLIGGYEKSGGTHLGGGAFDITDLVGDEDVAIARQMGADACWARGPANGMIPHLHGILTGCPHNKYGGYQITEVRAGGDGLVGSAPDTGPRPLSGRTWQEGIEWAREQMEKDDMTPQQEKLLQEIHDGLYKAVEVEENGKTKWRTHLAMIRENFNNRKG